MNDSFFNTTSEINPELTRCVHLAARQDDLVLDYFRSHPGQLMTPSETWIATGLKARRAPLTSVRRAISNLTTAGYLVRTTVTRIGPYGRREYTWVYPTGGRAAVGGDLLL